MWTEIRPNGNQAVRRCKSSCLTIWLSLRFPLKCSQTPDEQFVSLFAAGFSVLHCDDSASAGDGFTVTIRGCVRSSLAIVIWNMLRPKPEGSARSSNRSTTKSPKPRVVVRRLVTPRGTTSQAVSVSATRRRPSGRSPSRDGEMPGSRGAEFCTMGEV